MSTIFYAVLFYGIKITDDQYKEIKERTRDRKYCTRCNVTAQGHFCTTCGAQLIVKSGDLHPDTLYGEPPHGKNNGCTIERHFSMDVLQENYRYIVVDKTKVETPFNSENTCGDEYVSRKADGHIKLHNFCSKLRINSTDYRWFLLYCSGLQI